MKSKGERGKRASELEKEGWEKSGACLSILEMEIEETNCHSLRVNS
jgi:hypothetical protein